VCISTPAHRDVRGDDGSRLLHGEDVRSHVVGVVHNGRGGGWVEKGEHPKSRNVFLGTSFFFKLGGERAGILFTNFWAFFFEETEHSRTRTWFFGELPIKRVCYVCYHPSIEFLWPKKLNGPPPGGS